MLRKRKRLAGFKVPVDDTFDGLTQEGPAEFWVALSASADCFLKVVGKRHYWIFCFFLRL